MLLLPCTVPPCLSPAAQAPIQGSSCLLARFGSRTRAMTAAARRVPEQAAASSWPQPSPPLGAGGSRVSPSPGGPLGSGFPLPCVSPPSLAVPSPGGHAAEQGCDLKRRSTEVRGQKNPALPIKKKASSAGGRVPSGRAGMGAPRGVPLGGGQLRLCLGAEMGSAARAEGLGAGGRSLDPKLGPSPAPASTPGSGHRRARGQLGASGPSAGRRQPRAARQGRGVGCHFINHRLPLKMEF